MRCLICILFGIAIIAARETNGRSDKLHTLRTLHLFAGAGGGILGDILLGHQCVCAVEIDGYCQKVLQARQKDGILPWFPIFSDVTTFDGRPWRGSVDVVSGGFPCQDISCAGKGVGIGGERSGLWTEFARIIGEVQPRFVFVENSPVLTSRGLGDVLGDLSCLGYDARWGIVGARHAGAPHHRYRIWIVAYPDSNRLARGGLQTKKEKRPPKPLLLLSWPPRPGTQREIPRMVNGLAHRMDRIKSIGEGQVPAVAKLAWEILNEV